MDDQVAEYRCAVCEERPTVSCPFPEYPGYRATCGCYDQDGHRLLYGSGYTPEEALENWAEVMFDDGRYVEVTMVDRKLALWQRVVLFLLSKPSDLAVYRNSAWRSEVHDLPWGLHLLVLLVGSLAWWLL